MIESIIASIAEKNAIDPKLGNNKIDLTVPFLCVSAESAKDAMKEVRRASAVKNNSLTCTRINLSTIVSGGEGYKDPIISN